MAMKMIRTFKTLMASIWLGWQTESNWADPLLFAIYSIAKPISSSLILVFMYKVVMGGNFGTPLFSYIYVGNAFYLYVSSVLFGISWTVVEDREWYETIKYIYISPSSFLLYLIGRGMTQTLLATIAVFITLCFGAVFLNIPITPSTVNWVYLIPIMVFGLSCLFSLGLLLAGIGMIVPRHSGMMNEGLAGVFYLLAGAIFPIDVLPHWLRPLSLVLPFTYWLEGARRATLGTTVSRILGEFSTVEIISILAVTTLILFLLSLFIFKMAENYARKRGIIERTTGF
jgi:ABC-2 type transport system permease protein